MASKKDKDTKAPLGIWIPKSIYRKRGLTATQKLLIGYLAARQGSQALAWPSYATIALDLGCEQSTIIRAMKDLVDKEEVILVHRTEDSNLYSIPWKTAYNRRKTAARKALAIC